MRKLTMMMVVGLFATTSSALSEEVGEISTDWYNNEIKIEAVADPDIEGVTCHVSYFDRGTIDRLVQGNWFEDPSNSSIACRQTGPIVIGDIDLDEDGEEVFSQRTSLVFKSLAVNRIYDRKSDTLVYIAYSRDVVEGSAKMSLSSVPLFAASPTWTKGKPD